MKSSKIFFMSVSLSALLFVISLISASVAESVSDVESSKYAQVWSQAITSKQAPTREIHQEIEIPIADQEGRLEISMKGEITDFIIKVSSSENVELRLKGTLPNPPDDLIEYSWKGGELHLNMNDGDITGVKFNQGAFSPVLLNLKRQLTLEVSLPAGRFQRLNISNVSGDLEAAELQTGELFIRTVSGDIRLSTAQAERVHIESTSGDILWAASEVHVTEVNTVSGDVEMRGLFHKLTLNSTSGDISLSVPEERTPMELTAKSVSGDIAVSIPSKEHLGHIEFETISGDFSVPGSDYRKEGGPGKSRYAATIGYEGETLHVKSVSGDLEIQ